MTPLGDRVLVRRDRGEAVLPWGFVLPGGEDRALAHEGTVIAVGEGRRKGRRTIPVDAVVGTRVLYSSRIDAREVDGEQFDVVAEGSLIGVRDGDCP